MEAFYYSQMWLIIIICAVLGIFMFPSLSYLKRRWAKILVFATIIVWSFSGFYLFNNYNKYEDLIEKSVLTNPATRKYEKKIFNDFYYSRSDYSFYRQSYLPQSFEKTGLYNKRELRQDIEYLGTDGNYFYIKFQDDIYYTSKKYIQTTTDSQAERLGLVYELKEKEFSEIGFIEYSNNFFSHYLIPENIINQTVSDQDKKEAIYQSELLIGGWLTP